MNGKWKTRIAVLLAVALSFLNFASCGGANDTSSAGATSAQATSSKPAVELNISAAASLTDVLEEIKTKYQTAAPEVTLTFTFGSSGALQTQIEEGAPADIFMSAAKKQMTALEEKGLVATETKKELLENKIVMIAPKESKAGITGFADAAADKVAKIALGDPASVPAGQYADEVFKSLNISEAVNKKAVLGSDVRQVLTWVETGEADCGVVYSTDAATSDKVTVVAEAPAGSYTKVVYPVAVLKQSAKADAAAAFIAYLQGDEAGALFTKYGFTLNQ